MSQATTFDTVCFFETRFSFDEAPQRRRLASEASPVPTSEEVRELELPTTTTALPVPCRVLLLNRPRHNGGDGNRFPDKLILLWIIGGKPLAFGPVPVHDAFLSAGLACIGRSESTWPRMRGGPAGAWLGLLLGARGTTTHIEGGRVLVSILPVKELPAR